MSLYLLNAKANNRYMKDYDKKCQKNRHASNIGM